MAILDPATPERSKKTVWLLATGAASLLIPLAGAIYLHVSQNSGSAGPSGRSDVFERREGEDRKLTPTQTAVVTSPGGLMAPPPSGLSAVGEKSAGSSSSLDFIKSNTEMQGRMSDSKAAMAVAAAPAASTAPVTPAAAAVAAPAPATAKTSKGKKDFSMPKLQPSRGFTNFGSTGSKGAGANSGGQGGQSPQDMLKNLPPGAENDPRVQAYLKSHQGQ